MKPYLVLILFLCLNSQFVTGQSFDEALLLYEQEEYTEAVSMFSSMENDERALLFAGKSNLALGNYSSAIRQLNSASLSNTSSIVNEALYTLALTYFRTNDYSKSLELLFELKSTPDQAGVRISARDLYDQILQYLTEGQRFQIFYSLANDEMRMDLIRSSIGILDYNALQSMLTDFRNLVDRQDWVRELENEIGSRITYTIRSGVRYPAPDGLVYKVGVTLPSFEPDEPEFTIPRNIFFGITLAAEEFNSRNPDHKVFLRYKDTQSDPVVAAQVMQELIWQDRADAIIGPLFSETAKEMARYAEEYEIPLVAPLANSDSINLGHNYTFQLNPTFAIHGRSMARFAVQELNFDTLAVIVERPTMGRSAALAFRHEAERLGAHIAYYFEEDFESLGYDISTFTEVFTADTVLIDSLGYKPVDAIYAPFTGQAAETMTNLLMTDLEAMQSDVVVMGSEEWKNISFSARQQQLFPIFYSEPDNSIPESESTQYFQQDFASRFGFQPDNFASVGYDAATMLFQALERSGNPGTLTSSLKNAPVYTGVSMRIHFNESQINQLVEIRTLTSRANELMGSSTMSIDVN